MTNKDDKLFKVRPVYDLIINSFSKVYTPLMNLSIDEAMIRYFGRLSFKMYNPKKPAKYGMKAYKICDSSGYTFNFKLYTGKSENSNNSVISLVLDMTKQLLHKGYRLFMDNWYSSPALFRELFRRKTHATGTVRMNRKHLPEDFEAKGPKTQYRKSEELVCLRWRDKRDVTLLSNMHGSAIGYTGKKSRDGEPIQKHCMVLSYNKFMGSVDTSDLMTSTYGDMRRSIKWYKKLIFYINDLATTNAYVLYKQIVKPKTTHSNFCLNLIESLIQEGVQNSEGRPRRQAAGRPTTIQAENVPTRLDVKHSKHWPEKLPILNGKVKRIAQQVCVVCKPKPFGRRFQKGEQNPRPQTTYMCGECKVPLHVSPCFRIYHTKLDYKCPRQFNC